MTPSPPSDKPCLWLPGQSGFHLLSTRRPPRLRVRMHWERRRPAGSGSDEQYDVPVIEPPTAQAPGDRLGGGERDAVALCGW
ncbi:hypothetical protein AB0H36_10325 [Kribbella sp. NPDC050820]|uniref:hypothetical protein n=1 Tax=Kribbella sp. NPDC050820 TaxID=3155408 RepID=UPI0034092AEF